MVIIMVINILYYFNMIYFFFTILNFVIIFIDSKYIKIIHIVQTIKIIQNTVKQWNRSEYYKNHL